jgi:hypothetical protein
MPRHGLQGARPQRFSRISVERLGCAIKSKFQITASAAFFDYIPKCGVPHSRQLFR